MLYKKRENEMFQMSAATIIIGIIIIRGGPPAE